MVDTTDRRVREIIRTSQLGDEVQLNYCMAGNLRQQKISSKATVRQFVRNFFSSNVGRLWFALPSLWSFGGCSFAYRLP